MICWKIYYIYYCHFSYSFLLICVQFMVDFIEYIYSKYNTNSTLHCLCIAHFSFLTWHAIVVGNTQKVHSDVFFFFCYSYCQMRRTFYFVVKWNYTTFAMTSVEDYQFSGLSACGCRRFVNILRLDQTKGSCGTNIIYFKSCFLEHKRNKSHFFLVDLSIFFHFSSFKWKLLT